MFRVRVHGGSTVPCLPRSCNSVGRSIGGCQHLLADVKAKQGSIQFCFLRTGQDVSFAVPAVPAVPAIHVQMWDVGS